MELSKPFCVDTTDIPVQTVSVNKKWKKQQFEEHMYKCFNELFSQVMFHPLLIFHVWQFGYTTMTILL